jgi:predicted transport protein
LRKKDEKIMELQETINANEEKFVEFQTQLDSFVSVQERRQEGADSLELLVSNLNQEIRHLKRAKNDSRKIGTFTKVAGSYGAAREEMHMETQVPTVRRLMKNILGGCDDDTTLKVPEPNVSAGLRALLSFGFGLGLDDQTPVGKEQLELLISSRPPYSIIETLIEAAVCIWVFESDFPNFGQEPGGLSLFAKYRELIAAQGK